MAEGDNMESEKQNGQMNGVDAAAKKAAEANGGPLKDNTSLSMGDESDVTIDKGSRRRECIFINLAIILGLALIGVLIYFSVANALQAEKPKAVPQKGGSVTTEMMTSTMTTTTTAMGQPSTDAGFQGKNDPNSLLRNLPGGGSMLRRGMMERRVAPPPDDGQKEEEEGVEEKGTGKSTPSK